MTKGKDSDFVDVRGKGTGENVKKEEIGRGPPNTKHDQFWIFHCFSNSLQLNMPTLTYYSTYQTAPYINLSPFPLMFFICLNIHNKIYVFEFLIFYYIFSI